MRDSAIPPEGLLPLCIAVGHYTCVLKSGIAALLHFCYHEKQDTKGHSIAICAFSVGGALADCPPDLVCAHFMEWGAAAPDDRRMGPLLGVGAANDQIAGRHGYRAGMLLLMDLDAKKHGINGGGVYRTRLNRKEARALPAQPGESASCAAFHCAHDGVRRS